MPTREAAIKHAKYAPRLVRSGGMPRQDVVDQSAHLRADGPLIPGNTALLVTEHAVPIAAEELPADKWGVVHLARGQGALRTRVPRVARRAVDDWWCRVDQ